MKYRNDIDGLRGIAVLSVILFHAGIKCFSGGYVGVDIFFVISGYLISRIVIKKTEEGNFRLTNFYHNRARRILPVLFLVIFISIPFSLLFLYPSDIISYSKSIFSIIGIYSNFYFWKKSNYFDPVTESNPLIHTWSLSLEEQYYFVFPIFLIYIWRYGKRNTFIVLLFVGIFSLFLASYIQKIAPVANFYLLPTRVWEFIAGSLIFLMEIKFTRIYFLGIFSEIFSSIGLVLIIYAVLFFDSNTPFPSFYTLIPVTGTALVIYFGATSSNIQRLLSSRLLIFIGLTSYSAYLWHQPLFAFFNYASIDFIFSNYLLIAITFFLSYFSWKYVEIPFRNNKLIERNLFYLIILLALLLLIFFSFLTIVTKGFPSRFSNEQLAITSYQNYDYLTVQRSGTCQMMNDQNFTNFLPECINQGDFFIWGDSHAAALSFGLRKLDPNLTQLTASSCPPVIKFESQRPFCDEINNFVLDQIKLYKPKFIVLHASWSSYGNKLSISELQNTILQIKNFSHSSKIFIIGSSPVWDPSLPIYVLKNNLLKENLVKLHSFNTLNNLDASLNLLSSKNVYFISILKNICLLDRCPVYVSYDNVQELFTWDNSHLTQVGSLFIADTLFSKISSIK